MNETSTSSNVLSHSKTFNSTLVHKYAYKHLKLYLGKCAISSRYLLGLLNDNWIDMKTPIFQQSRIGEARSRQARWNAVSRQFMRGADLHALIIGNCWIFYSTKGIKCLERGRASNKSYFSIVKLRRTEYF